MQSGIQSQLRVILQRREVRASLWDHLKRGANVSRHDPNDTFVEHVYNGQAFAEWKNRAKPGDESQKWFTRRNVSELFLILFSDGYQPFEHTQYSTDAILLALGNLPLALMRKRENLILVAMIPGTAFFFVLVCFRYWLTLGTRYSDAYSLYSTFNLIFSVKQEEHVLRLVRMVMMSASRRFSRAKGFIDTSNRWSTNWLNFTVASGFNWTHLRNLQLWCNVFLD